MGYIRLHEKDRARYGAPDEIPFDLAAIGVRQRAAAERASGRSLRWMFDQLGGVPELDADGNAIPVPSYGVDGEPVMEDDGVTPKMEPRLTRNGDAIAMVAWLALWGIGIKVDWETFEVQETGLVINASDDSDDDAGKAEESGTPESSTTG